jgi:hypothetical protein
VLALVTVTVAWEFYRLTEVKPTGDVPRMIVQAVMALFFWTLFLVVLVISQLTIATKRILRAIELSSSRPSSPIVPAAEHRAGRNARS